MRVVSHIRAVVKKNTKDIFRNFQILILFLVYPIIGFIMATSMGDQKSFFIATFATMHFVFAPIVVTTVLLAEEREMNTLRVLRMSGITSMEYLVSTAIFVLVFDMVSGASFLIFGDMDAIQVGKFLAAGMIGGLISIVIGLAIGTYAKSTGAANGLAVPLGMVFSFLPMIASFNPGVEQVSKYLYGQQIHFMMQGADVSIEMILVLIVNGMVILGVYLWLYSRNNLE